MRLRQREASEVAIAPPGDSMGPRSYSPPPSTDKQRSTPAHNFIPCDLHLSIPSHAHRHERGALALLRSCASSLFKQAKPTWSGSLCCRPPLLSSRSLSHLLLLLLFPLFPASHAIFYCYSLASSLACVCCCESAVPICRDLDCLAIQDGRAAAMSWRLRL